MGGFALATNYALPAGTATFLVENSPEGICFDGTNIWVANYGDQTITKLDEYSGRTLGTYAVAGGPGDICYGAGSLWIPRQSVMQITQANVDGTIVSVFPIDSSGGASEIVFDGTNLWACGEDSSGTSGIVTKYNVSGTKLGSCTVVSLPTSSVYCSVARKPCPLGRG
jgi:streptogramin lyase